VRREVEIALFFGSWALTLFLPCRFWAFNASSGQWANYSRTAMQIGVEASGTGGAFGPLNYPQPRTSGSMWVDTKGYLWLFGGESSAAVLNGSFMPDWHLQSLSVLFFPSYSDQN
jgi:hypothetical protein